jgi:hypothetical protein
MEVDFVLVRSIGPNGVLKGVEVSRKADREKFWGLKIDIIYHIFEFGDVFNQFL